MNKPTPFGKTYKEYSEALENFSKVERIEFNTQKELYGLVD